MINIKDNTNIIISPHLDDAVFSLGGLIASQPQNTKIITIFAGIPKKSIIRGWDLRCGFKNSTRAMNARIKENFLALTFFGINEKNILNLPLLDEHYRNSILGLKRKDKIKNTTREEIEKIIKEFTNDINIFIPICENNIDHKIVKEAFLEFYKNKLPDNKNISIYLYQDMPYFYLNYYKNKITKETEGGEAIEISNENFTKKLKASNLYKSQFAFFSTINSLLNKQGILSKKQAESFKTKEPYCEVVYKI